MTNGRRIIPILEASAKRYALEKDKDIYFNAGNHVQTVRLRYKDFAALVNPRVVCLVNERKKKAA